MSKRSIINMMAMTALCAAALAALAPRAIPMGPVPLTLAVFVICIFTYIAGAKQTALGVVVYLIIGAIGLPVFSGYEGGVQKLVGPTGGYLIGYIPLALIGGVFVQRSEKRLMHIIGFAAALVVLYVFGTAWLCLHLKLNIASAVKTAVLPFIPFDLAKTLLAALIGPIIKKRVAAARTRPS